MNASEKRFIQALDDFKALTQHEAETILNISLHEFLSTVMPLLKQKKIKFIIMESNKGKKYKLFNEYTEKRLYYIDKKHLKDWVKMQLPPKEKTSKRFQWILKNRLRKDFKL